MKLYGSLVSPYVARVVLAARVKGLDLPAEAPPGGGVKSPEYLRINPMGKMPALEADGKFLAESMVIIEYLDEAQPAKPLLPQDPIERGHARLLARITDLYLMSHTGALFRNMNPAQRNQADVDTGLQGLRKSMGDIEHYMSGKGYALGQSMGYADCAMLPCFLMLHAMLPGFGVTAPFEGRPRLTEWWQTMHNDAIGKPFISDYTTAWQAFMAQRRG